MAKTENEVLANENGRNAVDNNNNSKSDRNCNKECQENNNKTSSSGGKYQLRPRSIQSRRRSDSDWNFQEPLRQKRTPPLSRYRRKTANARERYRMRQINTAFQNLRGVLPSWVCSRRAASEMTKITTLKLASAYIRSLQDILDGNVQQDDCSWVFSAILENSDCPDENPPTSCPQPTDPDAKGQDSPTHLTPEADLMSVLCGTAETPMMIQDGLESLSYLSSVTETDPITLLLLDSDSHRYWNEGQHSPLVV